MSSAKWCPEIVLCNSSNEKKRDRMVKTWEEKNEAGGGLDLILKDEVYCSEKKMINRETVEAGFKALSVPLLGEWTC